MGAVEFIDDFFEEAFLNHQELDEKIIRLFEVFFLVQKVNYEKGFSAEQMVAFMKKYITENKISKNFNNLKNNY